MKKCTVLLLLSCLTLTSWSQKNNKEIEAVIARFFDGLSYTDSSLLKQTTTMDFILLEDGEVWNMDTLIRKIGTRREGVKRVNAFEFIESGQDGKIAWTNYFNTAVFSFNEKKQTVRWLESAILRKEKGKWRIYQLHSTRIR